jgi:dUTPase
MKNMSTLENKENQSQNQGSCSLELILVDLRTDAEKAKMEKLFGKEINIADLHVGNNYEGDSCIDLISCGFEIAENGTLVVDFGIGVKPPDGYDVRLKSRSSIWKSGYILANGEGVIDSNYRGRIKAMFYPVLPMKSLDVSPFVAGSKPVQIELYKKSPISKIVSQNGWKEEDNTNRGNRGFGSTGI